MGLACKPLAVPLIPRRPGCYVWQAAGDAGQGALMACHTRPPELVERTGIVPFGLRLPPDPVPDPSFALVTAPLHPKQQSFSP